MGGLRGLMPVTFLTYAIGPTGQAFGPALGFPPLPSAIVAHSKTVIAKITT